MDVIRRSQKINNKGAALQPIVQPSVKSAQKGIYGTAGIKQAPIARRYNQSPNPYYSMEFKFRKLDEKANQYRQKQGEDQSIIGKLGRTGLGLGSGLVKATDWTRGVVSRSFKDYGLTALESSKDVRTTEQTIADVEWGYNYRLGKIEERYKEGVYTKDQYEEKIDNLNRTKADELEKLELDNPDDRWATRMYQDWIPKNPDGTVNEQELFISRLSGYIGWATLGFGGVAGQLAKAPAKAAAARIMSRQVTSKTVGRLVVKEVAETLPAMNAASAPFKFAGYELAVNVGTKTAPVYSKMLANFDKVLRINPGTRFGYESLLKRAGTSPTAINFAKNVTMDTMVRAPLRRENTRFVIDTYDAFKEGGYMSNGDKIGAIPGSMLLAFQVVGGGPVKVMFGGLKKGGQAFKKAAVGEVNVVDLVGKAFNQEGMTGNIIKGLDDAIQELPEAIYSKRKLLIQKMVGQNLKKGPAAVAAKAIVDGYKVKYPDGLKGLTTKQYWLDALNHAYADDLLEPINKLPQVADGEGWVVAAKIDQQTIDQINQGIANAVKNKGSQSTKEAVLDYIQTQIDAGKTWTQHNENVIAILNEVERSTTEKRLKTVANVLEAGKRISYDDFKGLIPKKEFDDIVAKMKATGYVPVLSKKATQPLDDAAAKGVRLESQSATLVDDALFETAAAPKPFFREVGSVLSKAGLGIEETAAVTYRFVRDNAVAGINEIDTLGGNKGKKILNILQQWTEAGLDNRGDDLLRAGKAVARMDGGTWKNVSKRTTTDLRQLTHRQVQQILKEGGVEITRQEASAIKKAIIDAHLAVPYQTLGMADYLVSKAYKSVPFFGKYMQLQGALRYTYNPFFTAQEITETELLGQMVARGKTPYIAGLSRLHPELTDEYDDIIRMAENYGFFNDAVIGKSQIGKELMATRFGEAAQDVYLGRVSAMITKSQKRSMAGVIRKFALSRGVTPEKALKLYGPELEDLVRPIVQYPSKGVLNSNAVKMMNIAMFPSRYNLKVTGMALDAMASMSPAMQLIAVDKISEMENWLRSPQGVAWQQDNAAAIQFFGWLTPIGSIRWVFEMLGTPFGKGFDSVGDMGIIGGLPFGLITELLEKNGVMQITAPYVSPEDGAIYARYIPETMKAHLSQSLQTMLGFTFTYPGRTIGLPGKGQMIRDITNNIGFATSLDEWKIQQYTADDLPTDYAKLRQQIWSERYNLENGTVGPEAPSKEYLRVMGYPEPTPEITPTEKLSKAELRALKEQAKEAKKKAGSTKEGYTELRTGARKATFPSNLPQ